MIVQPPGSARICVLQLPSWHIDANAVVSDRGMVVELKRNANDVLLYKTTVGHCCEAKALEAAKMGIEID